MHLHYVILCKNEKKNQVEHYVQVMIQSGQRVGLHIYRIAYTLQAERCLEYLSAQQRIETCQYAGLAVK